MTALIKKRLRNLPDLRRGYLYITAADFGISVPDLQYRLRREGSSYQKLLLKERRRRLVALMQANQAPSLDDIAAALGYSCVDSAKNAINKWGDMAPPYETRQNPGAA